MANLSVEYLILYFLMDSKFSYIIRCLIIFNTFDFLSAIYQMVNEILFTLNFHSYHVKTFFKSTHIFINQNCNFEVHVVWYSMLKVYFQQIACISKRIATFLGLRYMNQNCTLRYEYRREHFKWKQATILLNSQR